MPQLKQPIPMKMLVFDVLLEYLVRCCDHHSVNGSLKKLRQCVQFIKENVCICIRPCEALANLVNKFLDKFYKETRPRSHNRAVLEILMDLQTVQIRCTSQILAALKQSDACRFRGLKNLTLDLNNRNFFWASVPYMNLKSFYLKDLTMLESIGRCITDSDLETIGSNCRKLKVLILVAFEEITDKGLRALNQCQELQKFIIVGCPQISSGVIHEFLLVHKELQSLCVPAHPMNDFCFGGPSLLQLDSSVYPSMYHLNITVDWISCDDLRSITLKFPNLTALGIHGQIVGDLFTLKSLRKLTELNLTRACNLEWDNLKKLLKFVGSNITVLKVDIHLKQDDLYFIFKYCGDIRELRFAYWSDVSQPKLIIPPFRKLTWLECYGCDRQHQSTGIKFGQMLNLEVLIIHKFHLSGETMQSLIVDNARFPNLKVISSPDIYKHYNIDQLRQIARERNLDVRINEQPCRRFLQPWLIYCRFA